MSLMTNQRHGNSGDVSTLELSSASLYMHTNTHYVHTWPAVDSDLTLPALAS